MSLRNMFGKASLVSDPRLKAKIQEEEEQDLVQRNLAISLLKAASEQKDPAEERGHEFDYITENQKPDDFQMI